MTVHCHGATNTRNTRTAGLSNGLPNQYATAAEDETPSRRSVEATGAVQQVHIIDGVLTRPPRTGRHHGGS